MKGIITEGIRSAFIRIIRLIVYIILTIAIVYIIGLFTSKKAYALVYKDSQYGGYNITGNTNGGINDGGSVTIQYNFQNNSIILDDYDYIVFKFGTFNFKSQYYYSDDNLNYYCDTWKANNTYSSQGSDFEYYLSSLSCNHTSSYGTNNDSLTEGNIYITGSLHYYYDNADYYTPCTTNSELGDMWVCPQKKEYGKPIGFNMDIKNGGFYNVRYNVGLNGFKYYYNNESTEIVNGLTGVAQAQQQTTTVIQQQTTILQDTNTTSSTNSFQSGVSDLTTSINAEISGVNDLTQIVLLPVTLFMNLSTGTCSPLQLVVPFTNTQIELPCMMPIYNQHFGALLSIFQTVVCAVTTYWVSVNTAKLFKEILDCDNDRIEVIDL